MAANINNASDVPLPSTPDLERQPLLNNNNNPNGASPYNTNGNGSHRSHIPSTLGLGGRRQSFAAEHERRRDKIRKCWRVGMLAILFAMLGFLLMCLFELFIGHTGDSPYAHLRGSCDHVSPISPVEFEERQTNLSKLLVDLKAGAYIAEPGINMQYFTDIKWSQSERPFFLVVQAKKDKTDTVLTKTTIVAPAFEASRARQKFLPGTSYAIKTWEEGTSAYKVVREIIETPWAGTEPVDGEDDDEEQEIRHKKPKKEIEHIYIDPDMRQFVATGLANALDNSERKVEIANHSIQLLRMQKSAHEIEILRCVAQTSVNVIRAVKDQIHVGVRESEVQAMMTQAYKESGLSYEDGGSLVLFGKDAALPHGSGNDTKLEKGMMVLIDTGARLHGYLSDITRTFWIRRGHSKEMNEELDKVWETVKSAQTAALEAVKPGAACSSIDKAARGVISDQGYGARFTHRLGHGLGMEGHEEPYLNIGNTDTALKPGMVFTNEPGIYVEGSYGIRLEDVVLVTETGYEILSGNLATSATEP
ncbi:Creatinase/aminopeptidase [Linnemannia elongata AG-77]|uniref:Creatinase/aminopeptidase n=1 Tax=Linnemannia elongata AG-77 TaxID=1314771 RepID=A0A197K1Q4_9FUNG|nr:Creatinase/aminopeptidase [Linnemannia elongata AG-77]